MIASDVGGHRELIREGENGCLFTAGSAASLAHTVIGLLDDRQRWPAMRSNGRRYVEEERNWANSVSRYRQVYGDLLG